jgi:DNA-binding transcriptional ArsR family regulator
VTTVTPDVTAAFGRGETPTWRKAGRAFMGHRGDRTLAAMWCRSFDAVDRLQGILGSELRADVLAALFLSERLSWRASELGNATGRPRQSVQRELEWLAGVGIVSIRLLDGRPSYAVDATDPLTRQLGQLVRQARGPVPEIREALGRLRLPVTAWLSRNVSGASGRADRAAGDDLIVLTSAPHSVIQLQLVKVLKPGTRSYAMSIAEWIARLQKGETVVRRARRARKLWVVGCWQDLIRAESHYLELRRTLDAAATNWREELSDEWDEDWDPFDAIERTGS